MCVCVCVCVYIYINFQSIGLLKQKLLLLSFTAHSHLRSLSKPIVRQYQDMLPKPHKNARMYTFCGVESRPGVCFRIRPYSKESQMYVVVITLTFWIDVTMGSYDGAETCELVGSYILYKIRDLFDGEVRLYRDDGLAILRNKSMWYNPPFSKHVSANVGRKFLNLIDTHFPKGHILHKLFNRSNVKVVFFKYQSNFSIANGGAKSG